MTVTAHSGAFDTPDNSLEYIRRVLDAGCGILEMDVTFRPDGTPVLIDFGISRVYSESSNDTVVFGTQGFAPPEQYGFSRLFLSGQLLRHHSG